MATSRAEREMAVLEKAAEIESKKNWWATGNSSLSREDQLKAQALNAAKESEKLKRYDELQAKKDALALATRNQDIQEATNEATLTNANAIQQSKNWNALQVANIRAGVTGAGKKDPSVLSANERTQAILKMQENGSAIGKPMSIEDAARQVDKISGGRTQVMRNADGTPVGTSAVDTLAAREKPTTVGMTAADQLAVGEKPTTAGMTAADTVAQRAQHQALVPGHKNDPRGYAVDPSTIGISTPKGEAPTALTDKQWQQYADAKSPGMQFVSNQPGMVGDQIARFKRADGSTFFANAGAARERLGDTLTPATAPPPLDNTPGSVPRATMPDAANRSAMNMAKAPAPVSKGGTDPLASIGQKVVNAMDVVSEGAASAAENFKNSLPKPGEGFFANWNALSRRNMPVYKAHEQQGTVSSGRDEKLSMPNATPQEFIEPSAPATKKASEFLNWYEQAASRNMPAYLQSRAAMQPVDVGQKMTDLFKWWKEKSGRNMPKYAYPGSNM